MKRAIGKEITDEQAKAFELYANRILKKKDRVALKHRIKVGALERKLKAPPKPKHSFEATDEFLSSYEWRKVRMLALRKYGPVCQCCGATPPDAVMNVDHIKPRKLYPQLALDVDNLQILCHECNHGKGNWDMTDWRHMQSIQQE